LRQTNERNERTVPRLLRAAATLLLASWFAGATAQTTLSISDVTPNYGDTVTISATGNAFSSDTDYRIGFLLIYGDQEMSRTDRTAIADTIKIVSASDSGISPTSFEIDWTKDAFELSDTDAWSEADLGRLPMKLFVSDVDAALPSDNATLGNAISSTVQILPGLDNAAGTLTPSGLGYDDAPQGYVSGLDVVLDFDDVGGSNGAGTVGTGATEVVTFDASSTSASDAIWNAFYTGASETLATYEVDADGSFRAEGTVPSLAVEDVALLRWYEAGTTIGYTVETDTSVTPSDAAVITTSPQDVTVFEVSPADFTVSATTSAGDVTFTWQVSAADATAWTDVQSGTDTTYTISPTEESDDGTSVRVLVTNEEDGKGPRQIVSRVATLTVSPVAVIPVITEQPEDQSVVAGGDATFTVAVSPSDGETFSYQWFENPVGAGTWSRIDGATTTTLTIENVVLLDDDGTQYRLEVTSEEAGKATRSATSDAATLHVNSVGAPSDVRVFTDAGNAWVTFEAPTTGGIDVTTYQYELDGSGTWTDVDATQGYFAIENGIEDGETYTLRLRAFTTNIGAGAVSSPTEFTVADVASPTRPSRSSRPPNRSRRPSPTASPNSRSTSRSRTPATSPRTTSGSTRATWSRARRLRRSRRSTATATSRRSVPPGCGATRTCRRTTPLRFDSP